MIVDWDVMATVSCRDMEERGHINKGQSKPRHMSETLTSATIGCYQDLSIDIINFNIFNSRRKLIQLSTFKSGSYRQDESKNQPRSNCKK